MLDNETRRSTNTWTYAEIGIPDGSYLHACKQSSMGWGVQHEVKFRWRQPNLAAITNPAGHLLTTVLLCKLPHPGAWRLNTVLFWPATTGLCRLAPVSILVFGPRSREAGLHATNTPLSSSTPVSWSSPPPQLPDHGCLLYPSGSATPVRPDAHRFQDLYGLITLSPSPSDHLIRFATDCGLRTHFKPLRLYFYFLHSMGRAYLRHIGIDSSALLTK